MNFKDLPMHAVFYFTEPDGFFTKHTPICVKTGCVRYRYKYPSYNEWEDTTFTPEQMNKYSVEFLAFSIAQYESDMEDANAV